MKIIRDPDDFHIFTTALAIDWGIRRCNIKGCTERTVTTIVTGTDAGRPFGLCEAHWQEMDGKEVKIELDFTPLPEVEEVAQ